MSMCVDFILLNFSVKNTQCQILQKILLEMEIKERLNSESKCNWMVFNFLHKWKIQPDLIREIGRFLLQLLTVKRKISMNELTPEK